MEWIKVEDRLPEVSERTALVGYSDYCLIYVPGWAHAKIAAATFLTATGQFIGWVGHGTEPTHWMPLPKAPH